MVVTTAFMRQEWSVKDSFSEVNPERVLMRLVEGRELSRLKQ